MKKKNKTITKKPRRGETDDADARTAEATMDDEKKGKGRMSVVNYEAFCRAWSAANNVSDVAKEFGIKTTSASAIANRLRKQRVQLKKFPRRGAQQIDVKRLNQIVAGKVD